MFEQGSEEADMNDMYSEAIDLARMERQLQRCAEIDAEHPPLERCARKTAMDCVCPCVKGETEIRNVLAEAVAEEMHA